MVAFDRKCITHFATGVGLKNKKMRDLSRRDLKKIAGGVAPPPGKCTESCGVAPNTATCESDTGDCSRDGNDSISCDGKTYTCPS